MANNFGQSTKRRIMFPTPPPAVNAGSEYQGTVRVVSATSANGGCVDSDVKPTESQTDTDRTPRSRMYFFQYGQIDDDDLALIYGPVDDGSMEERQAYDAWYLRMKNSAIQAMQTSMINLASGWWIGFVRREVYFDNTLKTMSNLALKWRELSVASPLEPAAEAPAHPHTIVKRITAVTEGRVNVGEYERNTPPSTKRKREVAWEENKIELARLEKIKERTEEVSATDIPTTDFNRTQPPLTYYKYLSPILKQAFWKKRISGDIMLSWFREFKGDIAILETMKHPEMGKKIADWFCKTADDTWTSVIARSIDIQKHATLDDVEPRSHLQLLTDEARVRDKFRNHTKSYDNRHPDKVGKLEQIMVPVSSKSKMVPSRAAGASAPSTLPDIEGFTLVA